MLPPMPHAMNAPQLGSLDKFEPCGLVCDGPCFYALWCPCYHVRDVSASIGHEDAEAHCSSIVTPFIVPAILGLFSVVCCLCAGGTLCGCGASLMGEDGSKTDDSSSKDFFE